MHARRYLWIPSVIAVAALLVAGCRGSRPLQRLVQVTRGSAEPVAEIEPPPQRLATSQPRASESALGDVAGSELASASAGSAGQMTVADAAEADATMKQIEASLAALRGPARRQAARQPSGGSLAPAVDPKTSTESRARPSLADATLPKVEASELMDAFSSSPPEVQELALRQLIAIAARSAESTEQPRGIDQTLADALAAAGRSAPASTKLAAEAPRTERSGERLRLTDRGDQGSSDVAAEVPATDTAGAEAAVAQSNAQSPSGRETKSTSSSAEAGIAASDASEETSEVRPVSATSGPDASTAVAQAGLNPDRQASPSPVPEPAGVGIDSLTDRELFEALIERLAQPAEGENEANRYARKITRRHLMVLAGQPDDAVSGIEGLSEHEQEYLRHQLLSLWTMLDPEGHPVPGRRFSTALPQLRTAARHLAAATDSLEIRSLAFCTEIEAYGQIKEFSGNRFKPGQQVILYCEVDHFTSAKVADGYETHLQGSYNIYNEQNRKVVGQVLPTDKQVSRVQLRDYFIAYQMYLPKQLAEGTYRLELTLEDVGGKKYGQASIPFEIAE